MAIERTFSIVKPDAVARNAIGKVVAMLEAGRLRVIAQKMVRLTAEQAAEFYAVHRERPFYRSLVSFMSSGTCMPMILEKAGAVSALRKTIGATDPTEAEAGTVRKVFAESKERNAIHASDSDENAAHEARFFFAEADVID